MSAIQQQLQETLLELRQLEKVASYLEGLNTRLKQDEVRIKRLGNLLRKHEQDLSKLEGASVRALFHKILGDKESQIEKERQEYLQQALQYNELIKSVELVRFEIEVLEKKQANREALDRRYEELVRLREQELIEHHPEVAAELRTLSGQINDAGVLLIDIREALEAGEEVQSAIKSMEQSLKNARNWGQWDMYGGSRGYRKHRAVDQARDLSYRVKHTLHKFEKELTDVYPDIRIRSFIEIEGFSHFTDIFFDNLITDWVMQQKINKALNDVRSVRRQVQVTLQTLTGDMHEQQKKVSDLQERREEMIVKSGMRNKES